MRVFARKQPSLTLITSTAPQQAVSELDRNSHRGWIHSVQSTTTSAKGPARFRNSRLTVVDILRVNHATIREGESHCIWPPSILRKFHNADVITTKKVPHYELKDANLTRVQ